MEIERKFLIKNLPDNLEAYDSLKLEQAYISRDPVIRIRRCEKIPGNGLSRDEKDCISYVLTVKGKGTMAREELNLDISGSSFASLILKSEGPVIKKQRYLIPFGNYTIELDRFFSPREGLYLAEVEFETVDQANSFTPPEWFDRDVTNNPEYHNSNMK